jgi:hypothetical protein
LYKTGPEDIVAAGAGSLGSKRLSYNENGAFDGGGGGAAIVKMGCRYATTIGSDFYDATKPISYQVVFNEMILYVFPWAFTVRGC